MPKQTIKIDSKLLQPFREIAGILGISLAECIERQLKHCVLDGKPVGTIAAKVVPTDDGWWNVEVNYLSPSAQRGWREITAFDDEE